MAGARLVRRALALGGALVAAALVAGLAVAAPATAAPVSTASSLSLPATVTADSLPTWQINGVVWDTVTVGDIVYATGSFTQARPPGTAVGDPDSVGRRNILAFDITTGVVTEFRHTLNGAGRRLAVSPDGRTLYVGGEFTTVDGARHERLAAFDLASGDLIGSFRASADHRVRALAVTATTVYVGGDFGRVGGLKRLRLAAVSRATGRTLAWRPTADGSVWAMTMAGDRRVVVGGQFQKLDGRAKVGIGALDARTGRPATWTSRPIPSRKGGHDAFVTDLIVSRGVVYGTANGNGTHWFDGRFAARASTGALIWLDNCYGASYSAYVSGSVLYTVGHAHDCSSLGAFPETDPRSWHRALAETIYPTRRDTTAPGTNANYRHTRTPSLLHWYPTVNVGSATGLYQGAWAVTGNGTYVALAGEFTRVDGEVQQGLARFAVAAQAPNEVGPVASASLRPTITQTASATTVRWRRTWDEDDRTLTYRVYRDDDVLVGTVRASSEFWSLGYLTVTDPTVGSDTAGTTAHYRVEVTDPHGNVVTSAWSR